MRIRRFINAFKKYGYAFAPINLIKWKLFKTINYYFGNSILNMEDSSFTVIGESKFKALYIGSKNEFDRIQKGERKILFYEEKDENKKRDIKIRWEQNRSQEGPVLALFDLNNVGDLNLYFDAQRLSTLLIDTNAMEAGISAINLITTFQLLSNEKKEKYRSTLEKHIKQSLRYIIQNYEKGICYSANHYFFNLLSVLWISESIKGNSIIDKIKGKSYKRLVNLLNQIIETDGSLYEGSTYYHKYVTESFMLFLYQHNLSSNKKLTSIAEKMVSFTNYASINGKIVGIGDNDSGRVLALPTYFQFESCDITLITKLAEYLHLKCNHRKQQKSKRFGIYLLNNQYWDVAVRLEEGRRQYRKTIGVHCHNDQLHISVFYKNQPFLVDKGVCSYITKDNIRLRNLQTSSHNTVAVGSLEQRPIFNNWKYEENQNVSEIKEVNGKYFFGGLEVKDKYTHYREIILNDNLEIHDTIKFKTEESVLKFYFHFDPGVQPYINSERFLSCKLKEDQFDIVTTCGFFYLQDFTYSPEYGMRLASKVAVLVIDSSEIQDMFIKVGTRISINKD